LKTAGLLFTLCALAGNVPAAGVTEVTIANPGFEAGNGDARNPIPGWMLIQHAGPISYESKIDTRVHAQGKASFRITRILDQVYGSISQKVSITPAAVDRKIELSAQMRTLGVDKRGWVLMLTVMAPSGNEQVRSEPLLGKHEFTRVKVATKLPAGTRELDIGALLLGGGTAWLDDVHLRIID